MSEMLKELARTREDAKHTAVTGEGGSAELSDLPAGSDPVEVQAQDDAAPEDVVEETEVKEDAEEETLIRIGDQTFKTQSEAIKYAETLEREKIVNEAYNEGIRETLRSQAPAHVPEEVEDTFEEEFYANPKAKLKEMKAQATQEAIALIRAETQRETLWNQFLSDYPDVRRKDAERIFGENADVFGKITDIKKGMQLLAQKTRDEYREIMEIHKPRTELTSKKVTATGPSGGAAKSVTPEKKQDRPLSFAEEMRKMRIQR